jgi:hypothetical protein
MATNALLIWTTACLLSWPQQNIPTLDVTGATVETRRYEPLSTSATGGGVGSSIRVKQPVELTLNNVQVAHGPLGEKLIYEITLENLTDQPIDIPWAPNPRDIEPSPLRPYQYQIAQFGLLLIDSSGEARVLQDVTIFGSLASHTLQQLRPHERIQIRAAAGMRSPTEHTLQGNKRPALRAFWSQSHATVTGSPPNLHETRVQETPQIQSQNTVPAPMDPTP